MPFQMPTLSHQLQERGQYQRIADAVSQDSVLPLIEVFFARFLQGSSLMSRLIGEPLALHAEQKNLGAVLIFDAERLAIAIAEIEFSKVAVQVIVPAVLVDALHSALEDREESFDGVGVHAPVSLRNVLLEHVAGEVYPDKHLADAEVLTGFVVHHAGAPVCVGPETGEDVGHS